MSAINLYTTKAEAFYFKDSQRNKFYEFGGIQLLPNENYIQKSVALPIGVNNYTISAYKAFDDSEIISSSFISNFTQPSFIDNQIIKIDNTVLKIDKNMIGEFYWSIQPLIDLYNELVYLKFTNGVNTYYSNPFYITALDEDNTTKVIYKESTSSVEQSIGLKFWFRQKSKQSELNSYYESSTKNTVTQAIKTHTLEMYESEFMSMDDLIMTTEILESPYLYIGSKRYSLFEAVKLPELTQQENFGKIKFTLATNN
jgi:hypothetical protein